MIKKILLGSFILSIISIFFVNSHMAVQAQEVDPPSQVYAENTRYGVRVSANTTLENGVKSINYLLTGLEPGLDYKIEVENADKIIETIEISGDDIAADGSYTTSYQLPAADIAYNIEFSVKRNNRSLGVGEVINGLDNISIGTEVQETNKTENPTEYPTSTVEIEKGVSASNNPLTATLESNLIDNEDLALTYTISNIETGLDYKVEVVGPDGKVIDNLTRVYGKDFINSIPEINGIRAMVDTIPVENEGNYSLKVSTSRTGQFLSPVARIQTNVISATKDNPNKTTNTGSNGGNAGNNGSPGESFNGTPLDSGRSYFSTSYEVSDVVASVYQFIVPIAVVIALIKLLISLIQMAASGGNPQTLATAKEDILATILGLLVVAGAVTLVNILGSALGV
jgi:hypothetical protein